MRFFHSTGAALLVLSSLSHYASAGVIKRMEDCGSVTPSSTPSATSNPVIPTSSDTSTGDTTTRTWASSSTRDSTTSISNHEPTRDPNSSTDGPVHPPTSVPVVPGGDSTTRTGAPGTPTHGTHSPTASVPVVPSGSSNTGSAPGGATTSGSVVGPSTATNITPGVPSGSPVPGGTVITSSGVVITIPSATPTTSGSVVVIPGTVITSGSVTITVPATTGTMSSGVVVPISTATPTTSSGMVVIPGTVITSGSVVITIPATTETMSSGVLVPIPTATPTTSGGTVVIPGTVVTSSGVVITIPATTETMSSGVLVPVPTATATTSGGTVVIPGTVITSGSVVITIPATTETMSSGVLVPITPAASSTIIPAAIVVSSVSAVSSDLAGLIPIITGWGGSPGSVDTGATIDKINDVKGQVDGLAGQLGGGGDSGPTSTSCDGSVDPSNLVGSLLDTLHCIDQDLSGIVTGIGAGDAAAVGSLLNGLAEEIHGLGEVQGDITAPVEVTAAPSTTTGTTTSATPSPSSAEVLCSRETCGDVCSGADNGLVDISPDSLDTKDGWPVDRVGLSPNGMAAPSKRALEPVSDERGQEIIDAITSGQGWLNHQAAIVTATWDSFDNVELAHLALRGIHGLYGCTAVIIITRRGVYTAHLFEVGVFRRLKPGVPDTPENNANPLNFMDTDYERDIKPGALATLWNGEGATTASLEALKNEGKLGGDFVRIYVVTPLNADGLTYRYYDQAHHLAADLLIKIGGNAQARTFGYTRDYNRAIVNGVIGRTFVEVEPNAWHVADQGVPNPRVFFWRLWVADAAVDEGSLGF